MNATLHEARQRVARARTPDDRVIALESLLVHEPSNAEALLALARSQLRRGQTEAALQALDRAEAITGVSVRTARIRGETLHRAGRHADAADALQEAVTLGEQDLWPLIQLGRCRIRTGELEKAHEAGVQAVERSPGSPAGWALLADIAIKERDLMQAEQLMTQAHACDPGNEYAYARLIEVRLLRLPPEERDQEVQVLLRSTGRSNPHLLNVLAKVKSELGDDGAAAGVWGESHAQRPHPYARKMQAYALRKAGRLAEAARLMRACLLDDPKDVVLFNAYLHLQRERGATAELEDTLLELVPIAGERRGAVFNALRKVRDR
jgi:predicted Zn-dependent protease